VSRPDRLVVVTGTGTEVGKTWWTAAVARSLRAIGRRVEARKPVQSFAPGDDAAGLTDAQVLAAVTDADPETVCPLHRWLATPMAPPMAAAALGLEPFTVADLAAEITSPTGTDLGLVEGAGCLRSPLAADGDTRDLVAALAPDAVLVVADVGLGVIHQVRVVADALTAVGLDPTRMVVAANRFDAGNPLHRANVAWLREHDGRSVVTDPGELATSWT
jgi:dethiobiotin synthetase